MSVVVMKYKIGTQENTKLFKNDASCDRFIEKIQKEKGAKALVIISRGVDNRAKRTINRLLGIPKRGEHAYG